MLIWNGAGGEAGAIGAGGHGGAMTRRGFFRKAVIWALSGAAGIIASVPVIRLIINAQPPPGLMWSRVGDIGALPLEEPVSMNFEMRSGEAYMHQMVLHDVWVIKRSASDFTVFSPICPHLGCHYKWDPGTSHFECPCHGSVFTMNGRVIGGPAPRPLDTLPYRIEGGTLYVKWERFQVGIPGKVRV
ncbi:MAG: ubiquinol-cytochrome c reductase iron-sulfur subunit [Nitrospiraceae bacterium]|nr:ubiquinol-cytochrome c reductase iron-sulfur subunit [Nitrospiraceae bacterium]MDA8325603.1 ubiquinol-cytochrome c reductase iron-sulfur subunit [Nitrospiraceae bacterium]